MAPSIRNWIGPGGRGQAGAGRGEVRLEELGLAVDRVGDAARDLEVQVGADQGRRLGGGRHRLDVADVVRRHAEEAVGVAVQSGVRGRGRRRGGQPAGEGAVVVRDVDVVVGQAGAAGVVAAGPAHGERGEADGRQGEDRTGRCDGIDLGGGLGTRRRRLALADDVGGDAVEGVGVVVGAGEGGGRPGRVGEQRREGPAVVGDVDVV